MSNTDKVEEIVKSELTTLEEAEKNYLHLQEALNDDPKFQQFLSAQKQFNELSATVWKNVETAMIENNIKSIKTDRVTLTIAERTGFNIDTDLLPSKFIKKVPDTTLINGTYKLEGKLPKGVTLKAPTKYLVKRIK